MRVTRDRGSSTVELVILVPALLLLVLTSIHIVMFFYSSHVAQAAAARGAAVGSASTSEAATAQSARDAASDFVAEVNSIVIGVPTVEVTASEVRVTVEVDVPDIVPFMRSTVRRSAIEPRELVVPEVLR